VIFDAQDMNADDEEETTTTMFVPQRNFVKVNFLGDWHGPER